MPLTDSDNGLTALVVHPTYYEIVFHEATRAAVDSFLAQIEAIWELHNQTRAPIPILVVNPTEGYLPLNYTFNQGTKLIRRFPKLPLSRMVFLGPTPNSFMARMVDLLVQVLPLGGFRHRHLDTHQRIEAVAWLSELNANLLSDDPSSQMFPTVGVQQRP